MSDQATQLRQMIEHGAGGSAVGLVVPVSVPTGRVSFGPEPARPVRPVAVETPPAVRMAGAVAVASGKGGVGKSNLAVNLAVAMTALGRRVCLIDADLGLANADVLCNLTPRFTLDDVVHGRCRLADAMLAGPGGFQMIPGASGVTRMADLSTGQRHQLLQRLAVLERAMDLILIDTGAGISRNVLSFAVAAQRVLVTVTPEPTSITDGYGLIKALLRASPDVQLEVVVNMAGSDAEGRAVFRRLDRVSRTFLSTPLIYAGHIPDDPAVREAVRRRTPFLVASPRCPAARHVEAVARHLAQPAGDGSDAAAKSGFLARLAHWIGARP